MDYEKAYKKALSRAKSFRTPDNKDVAAYIFPELKESEDERIRKHLLYHFRNKTKKEWNGIPINDILAWLEKQGEHKKFRDSIQVGDKVTRNEDGELVNLSQLNRVAKKDKKQSEQNLIKIPKFKSGDTIEFNGFGHNRYTIKEVCGTTQYINSNGGRMDMSYTDANFKLVEQKSAEWSEEDEKMLDFAITVITASTATTFKKEDCVDWLKSLRPQSQWKPSDEQIKGIECAIKTLQHQLNVGDKRLNSLYDDLKKLREK